MLRRRNRPPRLGWGDRVLIAALTRLLPVHRRPWLLATPSTIPRWHRQLVARRRTTGGLRALVVRLATENLGASPIQGELAGLGPRIGASTVWKILQSAGIDPSPRRAGPSWVQFLRAQVHAMLSCDAFHLETVSKELLARVDHHAQVLSYVP